MSSTLIHSDTYGTISFFLMAMYLPFYLSINILLPLEKAMAPHSRTLAWKIPWTEEPGRQQSIGSLPVRHDWATSLSLFTLTHWRRKWHPTPVFLPWESQGWGSLVGCRLWGRTGSDTTKVTQQHAASLVAQTIKNLPATQKTWVLSLGLEDPLEKGKATHCTVCLLFIHQ